MLFFNMQRLGQIAKQGDRIPYRAIYIQHRDWELITFNRCIWIGLLQLHGELTGIPPTPALCNPNTEANGKMPLDAEIIGSATHPVSRPSVCLIYIIPPFLMATYIQLGKTSMSSRYG